MLAPLETIVVYVSSLLFIASTTVNANCTLGNQVDPTSPHTTGGQYIDLENPVECSGSITMWHFCYYSEEISGQPVVEFNVWRPTNETLFNRVYHKRVNVTVQQNNDNVFECQDVTLSETEYFEVQQNDSLGVHILTTNITGTPLHIIGQNTSGFGLYYDTRNSSTPFTNVNITADLRLIPYLGLHLHADIVVNQVSSSTFTTVHFCASAAMTSQESSILPSSSEQVPQSTQQMLSTFSSVQMDASTTSPQPTTSSFSLVESMVAIETMTSRTMPTSEVPTLRYLPSTTPLHSLTAVMATLNVTADPEASSSEFGAGIIAAIALGFVFVATIVGLTLLVCLCVLYRKRRSNRNSKMPNGENAMFYMDNVVYTGEISGHLPMQSSQEHSCEHPNQTPQTNNGTNGTLSPPNPYEVPLVASISASKSNDLLISMQSRASNESHYIIMRSDTEIRQQLSLHQRLSSDSRNDKSQSVASTTSGVYSALDPSSEYYKLLEQASEGEGGDLYYAPPSSEGEILLALEKQGIQMTPRSHIEITTHLGSGQFGTVEKGTWRSSKYGISEVAVKVLQARSSEEERIKFLQEAAIMGQFRHPNVVQLYGVVMEGNPIMLVLEYLLKSDLRRCLVRLKKETLPKNTPQTFLNYSQQVALGMHYLASKGFVHRDLAARNVFVSQDNICKVGDFGMSRDLADAEYYVSHGGKIPVRWTAPEAMYYRKYSTASDVWSYGCLLYEIWSLGVMPFKNYTNAEVIEKVDSGYRLPPPPGCPKAIYELMIKCWHPRPLSRPGFRDIILELLKDERQVLHIPVCDASTTIQASVLGAHIQAGEYMYTDLQRIYIAAKERNDYDHIAERKYMLSFPTSSADIDFGDNTSSSSNTPRQSYRWTLLTSDTGSDYEDI